MTHTADVAAFRLSRIYAQGWNTARTAKSAEHANPYPANPERGQWQAGFADAEKSGKKQPNKAAHGPLPLAVPVLTDCGHDGTARAEAGNPAQLTAPLPRIPSAP